LPVLTTRRQTGIPLECGDLSPLSFYGGYDSPLLTSVWESAYVLVVWGVCCLPGVHKTEADGNSIASRATGERGHTIWWHAFARPYKGIERKARPEHG